MDLIDRLAELAARVERQKKDALLAATRQWLS